MHLPFKIFHEDKNMLVGSTNNVLISMIVGPLEMQHADILRAGHKQVLAAGFQKISGMTLLDAHVAPKVKPEVRNAMAKVAEDTVPWGLASVQVIDGEGIGAMLIRTILAGINVATQTKWPHKVMRTTADGAVWISQFMVPVPEPEAVEAWAKVVAQAFAARLRK